MGTFKLWTGVALACALALPAAAQSPITKPIGDGQKIVMATHPSNVLVGPTRASPRDPNAVPTPGPLAALAAERHKAGHETLAVQMIGGSTPMQHWKQGDGDDSKNIAKAALSKG